MPTKNLESSAVDELRPEYDFAGGVRGKHHEAFRKGTNVVFLDPDIAEVFKDSAAVNNALRLLVTLAREQTHARWSLPGEAQGEYSAASVSSQIHLTSVRCRSSWRRRRGRGSRDRR